jgi:hypothetical protein
MKNTDYTLLGKLIRELYDENNKVLVETTFATDADGYYNPITFDENGKIQGTSGHYPTKSGSKTTWPNGIPANAFHATSFKIGKYTFRQLFVPIRGEKAYNIKFLVRGPKNEEATYDWSNGECHRIWFATGYAYAADKPGSKNFESLRNLMRQYLLNTLRDESLRKIAAKNFVKYTPDYTTIYDKATKKLKSLGVETTPEKMHKTLRTIKARNKEK